MNRHILLFLFLLLSLSATAQPKYEVRAAWVTTIYGLDWPKNEATDSESRRLQQDELLIILDKLKAANFNTVLLQTRIRGNVIYPSACESISSVFTGKVNGYPGYDPLQFAVEECHKRGIECHAWMVAFPLGSRKQVNELGKESVTRKLPAICKLHKNEWFLNPAHPQTKEYLMKLVREVIEKYDVDGVHFDYFRYPEHVRNLFDQDEYKKYGRGKKLEQWRRDNLTETLRYIYKEVKDIKPWVKVSSSPLGKYDNTSRYSAKGWTAYNSVYQDVSLWLKEGLQDQIYPMMYFFDANFDPFALDWQERSNGRHIIPGLGIYLLDTEEKDRKREDIERQIYLIRNCKMPGTAYYRTKYLMDNVKGLYDELATKYYATPALQPPLTWLDNIPPAPPTHPEAKHTIGYTHLRWSAAVDNDTLNAPYYVIYASDTYPVDTSRPENIAAQSIRETNYTYAPLYPWEMKEYFAVTAIDRYGNESEPVQLKFVE